MQTKDIFRALQDGHISAEAAQAEIVKRLGGAAPAEASAERVGSGHPASGTPIAAAAGRNAGDVPAAHAAVPQGHPPDGQLSPVVELSEPAPGVVVVTMADRASKNTFSRELITGLLQAFHTIGQRQDCRVVVLTGYDSYFACGGSREGLMALSAGEAKMTDIHLYSLALECEVPVIAAMQGHGLGGGWCMGLFCDFIVMSRESTYSCNHMKYGFTPGDGATLILPEKLGPALGQELLFTGRSIKGAELAERGVQHPIVSKRDVLPTALALAREFAAKPREALVLLKAHMTGALRARLSETIEREWAMQERTLVNRPEVLDSMLAAFEPAAPAPAQASGSPRLVRLNSAAAGRPVFWLHGEGGGVEGYQLIARNIARPFFGIEAQGHMTEDAPIRGIAAMAARYAELIRAAQPQGPYELGGYSLGGVLAYETACRLQEAGQQVQSLVLLDTPDSSAWSKLALSEPDRALQAVNLALLNRTRLSSAPLAERLIHCREIPGAAAGSAAQLLPELVRLGRERGLSRTKPESELVTLFAQNLRLQAAFELERYVPQPLADPQGPACCYVRSGSSRYYGELAPYMTATGDGTPLDGEDYWSGWARLLPKLQLLEAGAASHVTLLFEPTSQVAVTALCESLYAEPSAEVPPAHITN